jgi:hypothetical protein
MESSLKVTDDLCRCPDALSLVATPYAKLCYKCGRVIDIQTWKHWQTIDPHDAQTIFYAFGMKRDDKQELTGKTFDYFRDEIMHVKYLLYAGSTSFHDWFLTLNDEEKARTIDEMKKVENGKVRFEESHLKAGFDEYQTIKKETKQNER